MISRSFAELLGLIAIAAILFAADLWKVKPVREWSREETVDFFRNSPWVRQVSVGGSLLEAGPPDVSAQTREGRGEESAAAGRTGSSELEVGGAGRESAQRGTVYFIAWTSAKIWRQANLHFGTLQGRAKEEGAEPPDLTFYRLSIGGPDLRGFAGATEAGLKAATYLRPKRAKTRIEPAEVKIQKAQGDRITSLDFTFPREVGGRPAIAAQEKSVEFACRFRDLSLKASFDLNKMATEKGRDL